MGKKDFKNKYDIKIICKKSINFFFGSELQVLEKLW